MRREIGPFPVWLWLAIAAIAGWYVASRARGEIKPARIQAVLADAFDEPHERAELVRGLATGLISAVLSFYLLRRWGRLGKP